MKKLAIFLLILAFVVILAFVGVNAWYESAIASPAGDSEKSVVFEIAPGDTQDEIADKLLAEGLINDKLPFTIYLRLNTSLAEGIQAGLFDISASMNIKEVVAVLQKARRGDEVKITIPEGLRYDEIARILEGKFKDAPDSKFDKVEFLRIAEKPDNFIFTSNVQAFLDEHKPKGESLEGFLFPETYFMQFDTTAKQVIERLITTLEEQLTDKDLVALRTSNYSFYEILNIASMIEREAFTDEEKPLLADVIYKRLEQGVEGVKLLQIDATLLYGARDWKADAFRLKEVDGPYNTYKNPGLPPTPIANPGIVAIQAALFPEANDYFFYIHDNDGKVHFAKTNAEHEANKRKYLE